MRASEPVCCVVRILENSQASVSLASCSPFRSSFHPITRHLFLNEKLRLHDGHHRDRARRNTCSQACKENRGQCGCCGCQYHVDPAGIGSLTTTGTRSRRRDTSTSSLSIPLALCRQYGADRLWQSTVLSFVVTTTPKRRDTARSSPTRRDGCTLGLPRRWRGRKR